MNQIESRDSERDDERPQLLLMRPHRRRHLQPQSIRLGLDEFASVERLIALGPKPCHQRRGHLLIRRPRLDRSSDDPSPLVVLLVRLLELHDARVGRVELAPGRDEVGRRGGQVLSRLLSVLERVLELTDPRLGLAQLDADPIGRLERIVDGGRALDDVALGRLELRLAVHVARDDHALVALVRLRPRRFESAELGVQVDDARFERDDGRAGGG